MKELECSSYTRFMDTSCNLEIWEERTLTCPSESTFHITSIVEGECQKTPCSSMLEILSGEPDCQSFIKLKVETRIEPYASYVTYEINIETNDPSFTFDKSSKIPDLPPKSPFKNTFDMKFVEKRREALEEFLVKLMFKKNIFCLAERSIYFLQSSIAIAEIKEIIGGKSNYVDVNWPGIIKESTWPLKNTDDKFISNEDGDGICAANVTSLASSHNSSLGCKRVSFCDLVTVAEIHST
ncbi:sorting nexin-11 [Caerostris extrusa]|uniref:Sorting nexin-11 n=1 Tax=Caerostris extrusa TaxID=172846 RepID=A0AAV4XR08_CAEEX|nr:sorting nexin-11 [Caerostris extrusa]